jgi:16S rRNA (cytosine967-C5)-methyltransferase
MAVTIAPARMICYRLLGDIESLGFHSDDALNSEKMLLLETRDRHLTTEIVYGTLRWQGLLDCVLSTASARPWRTVQEGAKILLRMSLYQMWKMDRVPEYAVVNDAVEIAKQKLGKGIDAYVNGILRHLSRTKPWRKKDFMESAPPWIRVSIPEWLFRRWEDRYGRQSATEYALSLNAPPRTALRTLSTVEDIKEFPFSVERSGLVPGAFLKTDTKDPGPGSSNNAPSFLFQDEASQLIPHLLNAGRGWKIWDACAAPGGKTAILSKFCGDNGRVTASDLRSVRVGRLMQVLKDSGVRNTDVIIADAGQTAPFRGHFDAVLADVPCSGLGTLRRNPEIKWHFKKKDLAGLQKTQKKILHSVSEVVRVGGILLYSTCSTEPEENEEVVVDFLKRHRGFSLRAPANPAGIEKWTGQDLMVRTYPCNHPWDGFFAALMQRQS